MKMLWPVVVVIMIVALVCVAASHWVSDMIGQVVDVFAWMFRSVR